MARLRLPITTIIEQVPIFRVLDSNNKSVASAWSRREPTRLARAIVDKTGHVHSLYVQLADVVPTVTRKGKK